MGIFGEVLIRRQWPVCQRSFERVHHLLQVLVLIDVEFVEVEKSVTASFLQAPETV